MSVATTMKSCMRLACRSAHRRRPGSKRLSMVTRESAGGSRRNTHLLTPHVPQALPPLCSPRYVHFLQCASVCVRRQPVTRGGRHDNGKGCRVTARPLQPHATAPPSAAWWTAPAGAHAVCELAAWSPWRRAPTARTPATTAPACTHGRGGRDAAADAPSQRGTHALTAIEVHGFV
jgi:hypothetical protein